MADPPQKPADEPARRIAGWIGIGCLLVAFGVSFASREQLADWRGWHPWVFWGLVLVGAVLVLFDWWTHFRRKRAERRARKDRLRLDL